MQLCKNALVYLWRYLAGLLIAVLAYGLLTLLLKATLVTVQGPTMVSRISETVVFFAVLSLTYFLFFRRYGGERRSFDPKTFSLFAGGIALLHLGLAAVVGFEALWLLSTGASALTELIHTGGTGVPESLREIPRAYYLAALAVEDACFIVFSLLGLRCGVHKSKVRPGARVL